MRRDVARMAPLIVTFLPLTFACAEQRVPPGYQPDTSLLARIESINIKTPPFVCPGQNLKAAYEARLDDGTLLPFATEYDTDNPPPLHISFLSRSSPEAVPLDDGTWDISHDPLQGARTGYRLNALLMHNTSIHTQHVVDPEYSCLPHELEFEGAPGRDGPRVVVRIDMLSSPFFERLLVAEVMASGLDPVYVLADARRLPRTDWLVVESRGGRGVNGATGRRGSHGRSGSPGCPGTNGQPGGQGGRGGPGGPGGAGGEVFLILPEGEVGLAWLLRASAPGGVGGPGGQGGPGGSGGSGGSANGAECSSGFSGPSGFPGESGRRGENGPDGPPLQVIELPREQVFRQNAPAALWALIEQARSGGAGGGIQR